MTGLTMMRDSFRLSTVATKTHVWQHMGASKALKLLHFIERRREILLQHRTCVMSRAKGP